MARSLIDKIIYSITKKHKHYVEVKNPPKTAKEKAEQRALLQYFKPENREIVLAALKRAKRFDLIGTGKNCLAAPPRDQKNAYQKPKKTIRNIHKKQK